MLRPPAMAHLRQFRYTAAYMSRWIAAVICLLLTLPAFAQEAPEPDPEPEPNPFQIKGRLQPRFQTAQGDQSTFFIRRGRLKAVYALEYAEFAAQLNFTPSNTAFYDGWVKLTEPFTGEKMFWLAAGQRNVRFGHDVPTGPYKYNLERSPIARAAFPGERDVGVFGHVGWNVLVLDLSLVNGQGVEGLFANNDPTTFKNFNARAGVNVDWMWAGFSVTKGDAFYPDATDPTIFFTGDRNRVGADFGVTATLIPGVGSSHAVVEFIAAKNASTKFRGGYFLAAQELVYGFTIALRYSIFDPNAGTDDDASRTLDTTLIYQLNEHTLIRLEASFPNEEGTSVDNNSLTGELMFYF